MKFCPICGAALTREASSAAAAPAAAPKAPPPPFNPQQAAPNAQPSGNSVSDALGGINNTPDTTADYDPTDIKNNTVMGVLAYLSILVFIPMFAAKESRFSRFHTNQGAVLLIGEAIFGVARWILIALFDLIFGGWAGWICTLLKIILRLVGVCFTILAILGIINVANGKTKELPIIGKFRVLK